MAGAALRFGSPAAAAGGPCDNAGDDRLRSNPCLEMSSARLLRAISLAPDRPDGPAPAGAAGPSGRAARQAGREPAAGGACARWRVPLADGVRGQGPFRQTRCGAAGPAFRAGNANRSARRRGAPCKAGVPAVRPKGLRPLCGRVFSRGLSCRVVCRSVFRFACWPRRQRSCGGWHRRPACGRLRARPAVSGGKACRAAATPANRASGKPIRPRVLGPAFQAVLRCASQGRGRAAVFFDARPSVCVAHLFA